MGLTMCLCVACMLTNLNSAIVWYPRMEDGDWTLGAVAYLSPKSAVSVRRHTKVLADGEV